MPSRPLPTLLAFALLLTIGSVAHGQTEQSAGKVDVEKILASLHFHAPFDGSADAKRFAGDGRIRTADSLRRERITVGMQVPGVSIASGEGRFGDCLRFTQKTDQVLLFAGNEMHHSAKDWSGTVSLWMRLSPDQDLPEGYCDPLQITHVDWNDGSLFIDFDKDLPRDFRLGVFSDLTHWNPQKIAWDQWPVDQRPMITVKRPPFSKQRWTHVAFTFERINAVDGGDSRATLYLDGKAVGGLKQPLKFSWDPEKAVILLGVYYVGDLDDLMIFDRALNPAEVAYLTDHTLP
jgi:hypothetical protein